MLLRQLIVIAVVSTTVSMGKVAWVGTIQPLTQIKSKTKKC